MSQELSTHWVNILSLTNQVRFCFLRKRYFNSRNKAIWKVSYHHCRLTNCNTHSITNNSDEAMSCNLLGFVLAKKRMFPTNMRTEWYTSVFILNEI